MEEKQMMNQPGVPPPYPGPGQPSYPPATVPYQGAPPPNQGPMGQNAPPQYHQTQPHPGGYTAVPPPPPGMIAPPGTTVVVQHRFGSIPVACVCPNCHQNVVTRTDYEVGLFAWLIVGIIFICGGWIFCLCFLPFCIDSLKDCRHTCPNCNFTIHLFKRA